jgi:hypothetical protein
VITHAQVLVENTWSTWTSVHNTDYNNSTGTGYLTLDTTSDPGATYQISNPGKLYGGFYTDFYYNGVTTSSNSIESTIYSSDVSAITLSVIAGGKLFPDHDDEISLAYPVFTINSVTYAFSVPTSKELAPKIPGQEGYDIFNFTFTLDTNALNLEAGDLISINWDFSAHTAQTYVSLIQTQAAAVPEPATWAGIVGGLTLAGAMIVRRRRC